MKYGDVFTMILLPAITGVMLLLGSAVFANDSTARFGAGGIELIKNEHLRMLEEILEISPDIVSVKYRFFNESDQDIHTTVAFPLPLEHGVSRYYSPVGEGATILSTFKVLVNGMPVATESVRKAMIGGRDITDELRKLGLSDKEIFFDVPVEDGQGLPEKLEGFRQKFGDWWRISQTLYWEMTFPAQRETIVEHKYAPATGSGYTIPYQGESAEDVNKNINNLWTSFSGKNERENEDCLDETTKRAVEKRVEMAVTRRPNSVWVKYTNVEYILGTGRNWKGPIGEFKLRLIKDKPDQFVSVCFPGKPEKISPTTYEFVQRDFVPPDKLVVYFYTVDPDVK